MIYLILLRQIQFFTLKVNVFQAIFYYTTCIIQQENIIFYISSK